MTKRTLACAECFWRHEPNGKQYPPCPGSACRKWVADAKVGLAKQLEGHLIVAASETHAGAEHSTAASETASAASATAPNVLRAELDAAFHAQRGRIVHLEAEMHGLTMDARASTVALEAQVQQMHAATEPEAAAPVRGVGRSTMLIPHYRASAPEVLGEAAGRSADPAFRRDRARGGDPLVRWWKTLPNDPDREQRWYRRMKLPKASHARLNGQQIMAVTEETKGTGIEKRARQTFFGFDTVEFEHPEWSREQCLEHWTMLVHTSKEKIVTDDGEVMLSLPRKLIVDDLSNNMHYSRVKRAKIVHNTDDMTASVGDAADSDDRFRRTLQLSRPLLAGRIPSEAKRVDTIDGNVSDSLRVALCKKILQPSIEQDMVHVAVEQAKEDEELLAEATEDLAKSNHEAVVARHKGGSPDGQKVSCASLNTLLIEKAAKLDSSIVRLRGELVRPEVECSHLVGDELDAAMHEHAQWEVKSKHLLDDYAAKVCVWKSHNTVDVLAPNGQIHDRDIVVRTVLDSFKTFFAKDGHAKAFRESMLSWKNLHGSSTEPTSAGRRPCRIAVRPGRSCMLWSQSPIRRRP